MHSIKPIKKLVSFHNILFTLRTIGFPVPISGYALRNCAMYVMIDFSSGLFTSTSKQVKFQGKILTDSYSIVHNSMLSCID